MSVTPGLEESHGKPNDGRRDTRAWEPARELENFYFGFSRIAMIAHRVAYTALTNDKGDKAVFQFDIPMARGVGPAEFEFISFRCGL